MSLDKTTVRNIAFLARIEVSDAEVARYSGELSGIIDWIEQLREVDTDGVDPMTSVGDLALPWRADEVTDGGYPEKVTANAPDPMEGFFAVPKMVE